MVYRLKIKEQINWDKIHHKKRCDFFLCTIWNKIKSNFIFSLLFLHIDAYKFSYCLDIYNSIITSTFVYLNEYICAILLTEISKKLHHETEAYFLTPWVAVQKNIGFFRSVFSLSSLLFSISFSMSIWTMFEHIYIYVRCFWTVKNFTYSPIRLSSMFNAYIRKDEWLQ